MSATEPRSETNPSAGGGHDRSAFRFYDRAAAIAKLTTVEVDGEPVKVTATAKTVAWALAYRTNAKTGLCNPKRETFATDVGVDVGTVSRAIALLTRIGAVEVVYGKGNRASYELRQKCATARISHPEVADGALLEVADGALPTSNYEVELRSSLSRRARAETAEDRSIGEPNGGAPREKSDALTDVLSGFVAHFYDNEDGHGTPENLAAARKVWEAANGDKALIKAVLAFARSDGFWIENGYVETLSGFAKYWPRILKQHRAKQKRDGAGTAVDLRPTSTCYEHNRINQIGACPDCASREAAFSRTGGTALAALAA